jgi:CheY-like chemotaxis protein
VLIVEDEELVRELMSEVLAELGYDVTVASNGAEAGSAVAGDAGRFDLVITDMVMPGDNGLELARVLRQAQPGLRVLLISGYAHNNELVSAAKAEGAHYLPKPFTPTTLAAAVARALAGAHHGA